MAIRFSCFEEGEHFPQNEHSERPARNDRLGFLVQRPYTPLRLVILDGFRDRVFERLQRASRREIEVLQHPLGGLFCIVFRHRWIVFPDLFRERSPLFRRCGRTAHAEDATDFAVDIATLLSWFSGGRFFLEPLELVLEQFLSPLNRVNRILQ